jgi:hypothetical protein
MEDMMSNKFYKIFTDQEDYPDNIADRGIPPNTLFSYVSSSLLDGFVNYTIHHEAYLIPRYSKFVENAHIRNQDDDNEVTDLETFKQTWNRSPHTEVSNAPDDVIILSESADSFWFFYYDQDTSDCQIGRYTDHSNNWYSFDSFTKYIWFFEMAFRIFLRLLKNKGWIYNI